MPALPCATGTGGLVRAETVSEPTHLTEDKASSMPRTAADLPLMRWVWRDYLRPQRLAMGLAIVFMAIEGSMLGALSYVVKPMFDNVFIAGDKGAVYWVAAAVGGIFLLRAFSAFAHRILMQGAGLKIIAAMQRDMVRHLMTLDSSYFQSNPPGTLIERVRGDTSAASGIWQQVLSAGVRDVISLVALLAVAVSGGAGGRFRRCRLRRRRLRRGSLQRHDGAGGDPGRVGRGVHPSRHCGLCH